VSLLCLVSCVLLCVSRVPLLYACSVSCYVCFSCVLRDKMRDCVLSPVSCYVFLVCPCSMRVVCRVMYVSRESRETRRTRDTHNRTHTTGHTQQDTRDSHKTRHSRKIQNTSQETHMAKHIKQDTTDINISVQDSKESVCLQGRFMSARAYTQSS